MKIECLDESVSLPVELAPHHQSGAKLPDGVQAAAKMGKLWHLRGWRDETTQTAGFFRKNEFIAVELSAVESLSIAFMRQAKGPGFVSLEAATLSGPPIVLLQTNRFNDEAIIWLLKMKDKIESLFGFKIEVNDYGSDY